MLMKEFIQRIKDEEWKHPHLEFGGYLVIKNDQIKNIYFDVAEQEEGYVKLGMSQIIPNIKRDEVKYVKGWFHKHPINGLSGMDINTIIRLTNFWGECTTVVLQANQKLLFLKTAIRPELMTNTPVMVKEKYFEVPYVDIQKSVRNN